jgi:hypothetical protein
MWSSGRDSGQPAGPSEQRAAQRSGPKGRPLNIIHGTVEPGGRLPFSATCDPSPLIASKNPLRTSSMNRLPKKNVHSCTLNDRFKENAFLSFIGQFNGWQALILLNFRSVF